MRALSLALLTVALVLAGCVTPTTLGTSSTGDGTPAVAAAAPAPGVTSYAALAHGTQAVPTPPALANVTFDLLSTGTQGAEPSVGVTSDGHLFFQAFEKTLRSVDHGRTWEQVSTTLSAPTTMDPMLWVDPATDRVFADQLYLGCSYLSWTDDQGASWTTNPVACGLPVNDHQTVTTGPVVGDTPTVGYPDAVYYCFNQLAASSCSVSLDGGLTWAGQPVMVYDRDHCGGLDGHVRAGPDGTVYLPVGAGCGSPMVAASLDNGRTWHIATVSTLHGYNAPGDDPAVAIDGNDTAYYLYVGADGLPYLSRSSDHGATWTTPVHAGPGNLTSAVFPAMTAGSAGRIAFAYYGTTTSTANWTHPYSNNATSNTVWNLYVTFSTDADTAHPTFTTVRVNPADDPIQRGSIWNGGGGRPDRNLLDFFDITHDAQGRVIVAYTDGCTANCTGPSTSRDSLGMVAMLERGPSLLANVPQLHPLQTKQR